MLFHFQIVQGNFALFNKYTVGIKNYQNAIILVLVSTIIEKNK